MLQYVKAKLNDITASEDSATVDTVLTDKGQLRLTDLAMQKLLTLRDENEDAQEFCFIYLLKNGGTFIPETFKIVDVEINEDLVKLERDQFSDYLNREYVRFVPSKILQQNVFCLINDELNLEYCLDFNTLTFSRFYRDFNLNIHKTEYNSILSFTASITEIAFLEQSPALIKQNRKIKIDDKLSQVLGVSENISLSYSEILRLVSTFDLSSQYEIQQLVLERIERK